MKRWHWAVLIFASGGAVTLAWKNREALEAFLRDLRHRDR